MTGSDRHVLVSASQEQPITRHPGDVLRLVLGMTILAATSWWANHDHAGELEVDVFRLINHLPGALSIPLRVVMQAGTYGAVVAFSATALLARRRRLARDLFTGGTAAWLIVKVVKAVIDRGRPHFILEDVTIRGAKATGLGFPSGHMAVATALATVAAPYLSRRMRRVTWSVVAVVAISRVYVGVHMPLDVVGGAGLGWAIGAALHLLLGAPAGHPSPDDVRQALAEAGIPVTDVQPARVDARGSVPFVATTRDGRALFVKTVGRQQRNADLLFKAWRFLVFREVEDEAPFTTPKQQIEHEAYLALLADRAGVRTSAVLFTIQRTDGTNLLVQSRIQGQGLDTLEPNEIDDELLRQVWGQVRLLREARIAHRDLRCGNILVDEQHQPWVLDFGFAAGAATDRQLTQDVAELLASLSTRVGVERTVGVALDVLGVEAIRPTLTFLQPLVLSSVTRGELRSRSGLLDDLRERVAALAESTSPPAEPLTRIQLQTVLWLVGGALGVHFLLPQVGEFRQTLATLGAVRKDWILIGAIGSLLTYVAAAASQLGAIDRPLALGRTTLAQFAATFASRLSFQNAGGVSLITRYLERAGFEPPVAVRAVARSMAAGFILHVLGLITAIALLERGTPGVPERLPTGWPALVGVVLILGVLGVALWSPLGRRRVVVPVVEAIGNLRGVLRRPWQAVRLFAGAASVTSAYVLTFAASLQAVGVEASLVGITAVYLGGMAVGSISPTPSGLGAVEAALVAGLTVVGVETGPAVVGVLLFRLLTFWLPIIPGFLAFRYFQRRQVL